MSDHDEDAIKTTTGGVRIVRPNWIKQPDDSPFILPSDQNQNPAPAQPTLPQPQPEN